MSDGRPFIPAWLDEAGLSLLEFRLFCRILRRGDHSFDSKTKLEAEFKVGNKAMKAAFATLLDRGFITEETRSGAASVYRPSAGQHHPPSADEHHPLVPADTTPQCSPAPPPSAGQHHKGTPIKEPQRRNSNKGRDASVSFPPEISSDRFREAWENWQKYRKENRKALTPTSIEQQIKKLASWGEEAAIDSIETSISNGWTGLFQPQRRNNQKSGLKPLPWEVEQRQGKFRGTYEEIDIP